MPITREERDALFIMQGEDPERLKRIHEGADAMRARLEAEGRGPSTIWEPPSSDDGEIEPMTPPDSPKWTPRYATSKLNGFVNMKIQQPKLGTTPLSKVCPALCTSPQLQARKGQRQRQRRTPVRVSGRITRSKASKTMAFYELTHDNKTSQRVSSAAPRSPPKFKQLENSSPHQIRRSACRVQKR